MPGHSPRPRPLAPTSGAGTGASGWGKKRAYLVSVSSLFGPKIGEMTLIRPSGGGVSSQRSPTGTKRGSAARPASSRSAPICSSGRVYMLWKFTQSPNVIRKDIQSTTNLPAEDILEMLDGVARSTATAGPSGSTRHAGFRLGARQ